MKAALEDLSDWSDHGRSHLCEAALRLLAALGSEPRFPGDAAGIETLLGRVAEGRPGEPIKFAVEPALGLPRYTGEYLIWISPAPDGCLRLRHEWGDLQSVAVVLRPDGRVGPFESIAGFGVPGPELTDQARADRDSLQRLTGQREEDEVETMRRIDEEQRRFRTEHLVEARAAPSQETSSPTVSFVALYDTGLIVYYLVQRPSEDELETDDPWAEPLVAAMEPRIELSDGMGTSYEEVDWSYLEQNAPLLRASRSFVPAVPADADRLIVRFQSQSFEIELKPR